MLLEQKLLLVVNTKKRGKMNNQTSDRKQETNKNNLRIKVLLEKLRTKLKDFSVLDEGGHLLGNVKNVHLDAARQLNLVISEDNISGSHPFLIRSSHIQQVDYPTKSVVLDISKTEIQQSPEYKRSQTSNSDPTSLPKADANQVLSQNASSYAEQMPEPSDVTYNIEDSETPDVVEEEVIRLLEERVVVNMNKRKVGEVIVRKEVETRMVEVPVQYEKLIVEQVSPETKRLAEIDLTQTPIPDLGVTGSMSTGTQSTQTQPIVSGEFASPKTASLLLDAIAKQRQHGCKRIRIEMVLEDGEHQETYQDWFDRCAGT